MEEVRVSYDRVPGLLGSMRHKEMTAIKNLASREKKYCVQVIQSITYSPPCPQIRGKTWRIIFK